MLHIEKSSTQCVISMHALLDILRTISRAYYGDEQIGDRATDMIIGCAIAIGQAEDHPMTASDISNYTGTARTTVMRKLKEMEARGAVERESQGRRVIYWLRRVNTPAIEEEVYKIVQIIRTTCVALSKTDTLAPADC
jgi:DNA-binding transcriptional ArsR family regulator